MGIQVVYVPIGVGTYHMETAADLFARSAAALKKISDDVVVPEKVLLTVDEAAAYLTGKNPDLVILQNITFANAAYASEVLRRFDCPITLWTLREPVIDGGRLRSNSLTGAYSAANTIAANARYATSAPRVLARKKPVLDTGWASAISSVPDSTSRRNARIVTNTANTPPQVKNADRPASRAMRVASPNWW